MLRRVFWKGLSRLVGIGGEGKVVDKQACLYYSLNRTFFFSFSCLSPISQSSLRLLRFLVVKPSFPYEPSHLSLSNFTRQLGHSSKPDGFSFSHLFGDHT